MSLTWSAGCTTLKSLHQSKSNHISSRSATNTRVCYELGVIFHANERVFNMYKLRLVYVMSF